MSENKTVIRACLLYEYKLGSTASEAHRKICSAFGEQFFSERTARNWFNVFKSGNMSLTDKQRSGRPLAVNDQELVDEIERDSSQTCKELATVFETSNETIRRHLHGQGRTWKLSKWVPYELSESNIEARLTIAKQLLSRHMKLRFFDQIVTCDEKWILYDNRKRSHHWLSKDQEPILVPRPNLHQKKVLFCIWWSTSGIVYYELLQSGLTITKEIYSGQLRKVSEAIKLKMPAVANRKGVIFHQDNARPHTAKMTLEVIKELGWELLPHPPYFPDLAPSDYHLFLSLDNFMRNRQHKTRADVEDALSAFFGLKTPDFYKSGIYELEKRWERVFEANGNYFNE